MALTMPAAIMSLDEYVFNIIRNLRGYPAAGTSQRPAVPSILMTLPRGANTRSFSCARPPTFYRRFSRRGLQFLRGKSLCFFKRGIANVRCGSHRVGDVRHPLSDANEPELRLIRVPWVFLRSPHDFRVGMNDARGPFQFLNFAAQFHPRPTDSDDQRLGALPEHGVSSRGMAECQPRRHAIQDVS